MYTIVIRHIPKGWYSHWLILYKDGVSIAEHSYLGYNKKEMLKDFRAKYNLRYKHIKIKEV